jgi:primary-amine oxidase
MSRDLWKLLEANLVRYDAPAYATYVATNYHVKETKWTNANSIAIFEFTADHPLQRHTTNQYTSISRNTYLVVKSVSTGKHQVMTSWVWH